MTEFVAFTPVVKDAEKVPVAALQFSTRNLLSCCLNPLKVIPNEDGLPRDWRGLAHLVGLKMDKIQLILQNSNPTARVLLLWQEKDNLSCTIKDLQEYLAELDRFDVIDDTAEMIEKDISLFLNEPEKPCLPSPTSLDNEVDRHILTVDDVLRIERGLGTQTYDAFVVFADEDIDFATKLIEIMENHYGLKLCVKERDLIAGLPFEHKAIIELISDRCHRLIVIISPAYLKSPANKFVVNYAQALGIEQGKRKIIPCLYEDCVPPQELRHIFMLNYPRSGRLYNFWDKLFGSIQVPSAANPSPKLPVARSISHGVTSNQNDTLENYKSLPVQDKDYLKPKKENVKFGSLSDITVVQSLEDKRSASVHALNADSSSTSTDSSIKEHKKSKGNLKIFKKIFKHKDEEKKKKSGVDAAGKKWAWFNKKYKVPVVN